METLKPEIAMPMHLVQSWKQDAFVDAQTAILRLALSTGTYFSPGDIPEDTIDPESRQGVASNAWNSLKALGIIERAPMAVTIQQDGIFGGRKRNGNPHAKGRWCAVYYLKSKSLAIAWLKRHGKEEQTENETIQQELLW